MLVPNVQDKTSELLVNHSSAFHVTFISTSVLHSFFTVTAVVGNLLVLIAILKKLSLTEPSYALLVCLAISDLGVGLICHPLYVIWKLNWLINGLSDKYYQIRFYLSFISTYFASVSLLTVTAVSCERFLALHYHLRYKSMVTPKKLLSAVLFPWIFSALLNIFDYFFPDVNFYAQGLFIPLCLLTTSFAYIRIYFILRRHHNQIKCQATAMSQGNDQHSTKQEEFDLQSFRKSVTGMLLIYALQLVCYLPHLVVEIFYKRQYTLGVGIVRNITITGVYINSSLNPIIYCCRLSVVRQAIKQILGFKNVRQNPEH
ncbi:neuromedin-U receptor 2-like [Actinia tenebrosa]|uniref:Neuromedin-U receptor 2-like n=1 Tax=Actinia tenebrosa TaxID=6105 RepID=A0A6P8HF45_ACTTE|nr:neuromedin-U receptor 2-like [Actinia tenebrosa]